MKKIVFVHLLNDYSGSPKVLSQVIRVAQNSGYEVDLYTGRSEDGFLSGITKNHYFYFYKRFNNRYLTLVSFFISQIDLFFKLLKYRDDDVLFYINTMLPVGAGLAGKFIRKRVYFHIHETSISPLIFKKFLRFIIQRTADKIIFVSKYLKDVERFREVPQEVIYNVLDKEFFKRALSSSYQYKDIKNGFNILMVCSLKEYKGVREFIDIAISLDDINGVNFYLVLNATKHEIDEFFKDTHIPKNLNIIAKQKDLHYFYKKANLLLNLSRPDEWVETFGLTILEAMAYGVPCIVPPVGGPAEIVEDGKDGYLISSREVEKIISKIEELMLNREHLIKLSNCAKAKSKKFNIEYFEKSILRVLNEN